MLESTVGEHHVLLKARIIRIGPPRDAHRSFVDAQVMADAMAGTVQIIEADVPKRLAGQHVQYVALSLHIDSHTS